MERPLTFLAGALHTFVRVIDQPQHWVSRNPVCKYLLSGRCTLAPFTSGGSHPRAPAGVLPGCRKLLAPSPMVLRAEGKPPRGLCLVLKQMVLGDLFPPVTSMMDAASEVGKEAAGHWLDRQTHRAHPPPSLAQDRCPRDLLAHALQASWAPSGSGCTC